MDKDLNNLSHATSVAWDLAMRFGPRVLAALVVLAVGILVARWLGRASDRGFEKIGLDPAVRLLLVRVIRALIVALFLIMALQNLGVELLPLIAGISVAGAGVALATQGVLGNIVAGLTIIFTKPFRVGEYIEIVGVQGQVEMITLSSTTLIHADRSRVVVPNRKIVGEILHNYGQIRQVDVQVGVSYDADLSKAVAAVRDLLDANAKVLREPAALVQVVALADSAVQIGVKPWVAVPDFGQVTGELQLSIVDDFRRRGIAIAYPQMEVRVLGETA